MGGYHGRTAAALSATYSKHYQKIGIPTFDWPTAEKHGQHMLKKFKLY